MRKAKLMAALCFIAATATAQPGPGRAALDEAVRLGTVATLAPLCGMRDETWSFDLRRAMLMAATRAPRPDDAALEQAPGRNLAEGALSFAEAEALESFAESPAPATCGPLAHDPDLVRADQTVQAFRALKAGAKPAS